MFHVDDFESSLNFSLTFQNTMDRLLLSACFNPLNLITLFQFYIGVRFHPGFGFVFFFNVLTCSLVLDIFNHRSTLPEPGSKKKENASIKILQIQGLTSSS